MTARILNCSPGDYYRDPCAVPSLSQSIAHTLVTQSPLHAWSEHPRLGNQRKPASKAMDVGSLIHKLVLGKGVDVEIVQADNYRTKIAQEQRDRAIEQHRVPILAKDWDELATAADKIKFNLRQCGVEMMGESEVMVEWDEEGSRGPVVCRGMMDHVLIDSGVILDLKKCESAHPNACSRAMMNYSYPIQQAAYSSALAHLREGLAGAIDFVFLFVEVEPPFAVFAGRPDGVLRELGERQWSFAVRRWEECLATNVWPGYGSEIGTIDAPAWALNGVSV